MEHCIFCKILHDEMPKVSLYEDEVCEVLLDKFPETTGHALVLPKQHYADIFEIPEETLSHIIKIAQRFAKKAKQNFPLDGINILQNNGTHAGQTIFHFHLHIIPRYADDTISIDWNAKERSTKELLETKKIYLG